MEDRRAEGIEPVHVELLPAYAWVDWTGNESCLFQYRSFPEGYYQDMLFVALRDRSNLRSIGRAY